MPYGFDNTWGIVKDLGLAPSIFSFTFFIFYLFFVYLISIQRHRSSFSASVRPRITNEQEAFICRVLEIPFKEQKCRDPITLDTLHAYCGGL